MGIAKTDLISTPIGGSLARDLPRPRELRAELERLVMADLLGPAGGPEEEVDEYRIEDRYLVGTLAPKGTRLTAGADDDIAQAGADESEGEAPDTGTVSSGPAWKVPSSFGLTFMVRDDVDRIVVIPRWGRYLRVPSETAVTKEGNPKLVWKREPVGGKPIAITLREGPLEKTPAARDAEGVFVQGIGRRRDGHWTVSLFLANDQPYTTGRKPERRGERYLFQASLEVRGVDDSPVFVARTLPFGRQDEEQAQMALLYREHREFAVGHGVAVHAEAVRDAAGRKTDRAVSLTTVSAPTFEVPRTEPPRVADEPALARLTLDMTELAALERDEIEAALSPLTRAYGEWIAARRTELVATPDLAEHRDVAEVNLDDCDRALGRIAAGITLLRDNAAAREAFRFMNRAMALQRVQTLYANARRQGTTDRTVADYDVPANRTWRPFQLAFILANLPSLALLDHEDRRTDPTAGADLLWFPTGGGKTEAYLGLTAFTLAIRRLQGVVNGHDGGYGVAVLMRYTLRLLTLQQFQRATALICACEVLRREAERSGDRRWGSEPFRIGLWVGNRMTPGRTKDSDELLRAGNDAASGKLGGSGSPRQLSFCPWCGSDLDYVAETPDKGVGRTFVHCSDKLGRCAFTPRQSPREGIPVVVVDEEIYRLLPSLLIATVDKFALMPWRGQVEMLFGRVDGRCTRHGFTSPELDDSDSHPKRNGLPAARTVPAGPLRPPDLIIQDELHLISGPLGTMVGLYETAIDELATWDAGGRRIRPKVIASTATIRQAEEQVLNVFMRKVNIFPPSGLRDGDSFFARQYPADDDQPGRLYLGICARGTRLKAALIRVYTVLLSAAQTLADRYGSAADPYMTLVGYFGAMRELGGMRRLVDDDVQQRLRRMDQRGLANRRISAVEELTSRKSSDDIPKVLDRLALPVAGKIEKSSPIDVLLATNMISVGVDVSRLGLMVVTGQPKNTAEYIQATSRVGRTREGPGLVVTVYNWSRPRDLSHYERFEHVHATLYRQVEALSVTPFAPRAVDRGLAALLVSLVRLRDSEYNAEDGAGKIDFTSDRVEEALTAITNRAQYTELDDPHAASRVREQLEGLVESWTERSKAGVSARLVYSRSRDGESVPLLTLPQQGRTDFSAGMSLRDVESSVGLILGNPDMDDRRGRHGIVQETEDSLAEPEDDVE